MTQKWKQRLQIASWSLAEKLISTPMRSKARASVQVSRISFKRKLPKNKGIVHLSRGHPGGWPSLSCLAFSFQFRNCGCPVPSAMLRAGSCALCKGGNDAANSIGLPCRRATPLLRRSPPALYHLLLLSATGPRRNLFSR
jgi:hypothetical protein